MNLPVDESELEVKSSTALTRTNSWKSRSSAIHQKSTPNVNPRAQSPECVSPVHSINRDDASFTRSKWYWQNIDYLTQQQQLQSLINAAIKNSHIKSITLIAKKELLSKTKLALEAGEGKKSTKLNEQLVELLISDCSPNLTDLNIQLGIEGINLTEPLKKNKSLKNLLLSRNMIHNRGVYAICKGLQQSIAPIETLDLSQNSLYPQSCSALLQLLLNSKTLKTLNLDVNKIGKVGLAILSDAFGPSAVDYHISNSALPSSISSYNQTLTSLSLANNKLFTDIDPLCTASRSNHSLKSLNLQLNDIGDQGCVSIAGLLTRNSCLTNLNLSDNCIGPLGCKSIMSALEHNSSLEILELAWNSIGISGLNEGPKSVGRMFQQNSTLKKLNLCDNGINEMGIKFITQGLLESNSNCGLIELDLSINPITCPGIIEFSEYIANQKCKLEILDLGRCQLSDLGCETLSNSLLNNTSLLKLHLSGNNFRPEASSTSKLIEVYNNHKSLIELELDDYSTYKDKSLGKAYRRAKCNQFARVCLDYCDLPLVLLRVIANYHIGD